MGRIFHCRKISPGITKGQAILSSDSILFYRTDPATGIVTEQGHALEGRSVKDRIVIFPGGKGSSAVQADGMYKLDVHGTAPRGFIVRELDTVLVSSAIIMEMPMVDRVEEAFYEEVKDGDWLRLDPEAGTVEILDESDAVSE